MYVCLTLGIYPLDASTDVQMQTNPSYIAVEKGVTMEPDPCYSTVQASSARESTSGHGEDHKLGFEYSVSIIYFIIMSTDKQYCVPFEPSAARLC